MWRQHFPGKQHDFCFLFWVSNKVWHVGGGREVGGRGGRGGVQRSVCCVVVEVSKRSNGVVTAKSACLNLLTLGSVCSLPLWSDSPNALP